MLRVFGFAAAALLALGAATAHTAAVGTYSTGAFTMRHFNPGSSYDVTRYSAYLGANESMGPGDWLTGSCCSDAVSRWFIWYLTSGGDLQMLCKDDRTTYETYNGNQYPPPPATNASAPCPTIGANSPSYYSSRYSTSIFLEGGAAGWTLLWSTKSSWGSNPGRLYVATTGLSENLVILDGSSNAVWYGGGSNAGAGTKLWPIDTATNQYGSSTDLTNYGTSLLRNEYSAGLLTDPNGLGLWCPGSKGEFTGSYPNGSGAWAGCPSFSGY